jgi:hypothetical protein
MNGVLVFVALGVLWASDGVAAAHVFKHDQFSPGITQAANEVSAMTLSVNPGFAQGEAFGQIFVPSAGMYPVRLTGLDLFMAAPPEAGTWTAHAQIEVWLHPGQEAHPGKDTPDWSITTYDLFNPMTSALGFALQGGAAYSVDFDEDDPGGHPPMIYSDNFRVVVRFLQAPQDLSVQWGTLSCSVISGSLCGCQRVATVQDTSIVTGVNVVHHLSTEGTCAGTMSWDYAETLGGNGDLVMRVRADVSGGCVPSCEGRECGPDGCGGSCGTCPKSAPICSYGFCEPRCTPECKGRECGDDRCGGSCGTCPQATPLCVQGICQADCTGDCTDRECGSDGCRGSCGQCPEGFACRDGLCQEGSGASGGKAGGCATDRDPSRPWMALWTILLAAVALWGIRRSRGSAKHLTPG